MKIGFAGTGYIKKIHAKPRKFGVGLGCDSQSQGRFDGYAIRDRIVKTAKEMVK